jgi:hypothetical protein
MACCPVSIIAGHPATSVTPGPRVRCCCAVRRRRPVPVAAARLGEGVALISQEDAAKVVVDVAQALAVRGYEPVITHENGPRLVRLGEQMLAEFGIVGETAEENDG